MIFLIIKDIFWKVCVGIVIIIALLCLLKLANASEHQKVFDYDNWEDRFAIVLQLSPLGIIGLQPVPEELKGRAIAACLQQSMMLTTPGIRPPGGVGYKPDGTFGLVCLSSIEELNEEDNAGWKDICELFNMGYVNKPTRESVLCEKGKQTPPVQKYARENSSDFPKI